MAEKKKSKSTKSGAVPIKAGVMDDRPKKINRPDKMVQMEPGQMSGFIRHSLWSYYAEPIDIADPNQVKKRIEAYFEHCCEDEMKPTVMGVCNALGISRKTFHEWCNGNNRKDTHCDLIRKAKNFMEEMMESYMVNGKINPVTGIFLMKNNFNYQDRQEITVKPGVDAEEGLSPEELQQRYLDAAAVIRDADFEVSDEQVDTD